MESVGPTPQSEDEFSVDWVRPILLESLGKDLEIDPGQVQVLEVRAKKNALQGILSTTFVVDVDYEAPNEDGEIGKIQNSEIFLKLFNFPSNSQFKSKHKQKLER